jgi:hypothetical protein
MVYLNSTVVVARKKLWKGLPSFPATAKLVLNCSSNVVLLSAWYRCTSMKQYTEIINVQTKRFSSIHVTTGHDKPHWQLNTLYSTVSPSLAPCTRDMYRVILVTFGIWRWLRIILMASQRCCVIWGQATLRRDMAEKRLENAYKLLAASYIYIRTWYNKLPWRNPVTVC